MEAEGQRFIYGVTSPAESILNSANNGGRGPKYNTSYSAGINNPTKVRRRRNRTNKTKATRRLNPYLLFGNDRRDDIYSGNPMLSQAEIMKIIAEEWRALPNNIKEHYKTQSIEQKTKLDIMENRTRKPKRSLNDVIRRRPKKALTAYMFFVQDYQPQVIKMNPTIHFNDVMKLVGERWKAMSVEEKTPYEELSKKDQQRYIDEDKQMNGGISTVKPKIKTEQNNLFAKYGSSIFEYFASKMVETLKQDTPEANSDQVNSAIETAWQQMSEDQKYLYFQQNEQEIKDFMSIIDDQLNFENEDQDVKIQKYQNVWNENSPIQLRDIKNIPSALNNCFVKPDLSWVKEELDSNEKIDFPVNIKQNLVLFKSLPEEEYKKSIDEKLKDLEDWIAHIPFHSYEISEKIQSLRDQINSSILSELDTWLLFDSIEKLARINTNITLIQAKVQDTASVDPLRKSIKSSDLEYKQEAITVEEVISIDSIWFDL